MKLLRIFLIGFLVSFNLCFAQTLPIKRDVIVDDNGVMRWKNSNEEVDKQEILSEKERIKLEENRQFNETFNNMFGNNGNNKTQGISNLITRPSTNYSSINASSKSKMIFYNNKVNINNGRADHSKRFFV